MKGLLMPEHWKPQNKGKTNYCTVPLKFCRKAITGLSNGSFLNTDANVSFSMKNGNMVIYTDSLSVSKFQWLIKNEEILPYIVENGGFQKKSSTWQGTVTFNDIQTVLDLIYKSSNANGRVSNATIEYIKDDIQREEVKEKAPVDLSHLNTTNSNNDLEKRKRMAKVKAIAKLKYLKLLEV